MFKLKLYLLTLCIFSCSPSIAYSDSLGFSGFNPKLPVSGPGPTTNLGIGGGEALTNASAHVAWAIAIPLLGQEIGGEKGKWTTGIAWIGLTLITETFFHAPAVSYPGYPSEVRTDLLTRIVPTVCVLAF